MYRKLLLLCLSAWTLRAGANPRISDPVGDTVPMHLIVCEGKAQGTYYIVKYLSPEKNSLQHSIDSIFKVIDQSLSLYKPGSLINQFNAKGRIIMDEHMQTVLNKAMETNRATGGLFDVTVKPLVYLWGFGVQKPSFKGVPPDDSIRAAMNFVGSRYLRISGKILTTTKPGVQIDCNGIAQGYTVDFIGKFLEKKGISNYLVDVGGELYGRGFNARGQHWSVGVERPSPGDTAYVPVSGIVRLSDEGIATSGNYRKFFDQGKTRYAHTINPLTGIALHNNIISVTVLAKDCFTADAFDNPLILMGVQEGISWIQSHPQYGIGALYIYRAEDGTIREAYTKNFRERMEEQD